MKKVKLMRKISRVDLLGGWYEYVLEDFYSDVVITIDDCVSASMPVTPKINAFRFNMVYSFTVKI